MIPLFGSVFAAAFLGSAHCAAMCGGIAGFAAGPTGGARAVVAYNGARGFMYLILGALAGAAGQAASVSLWARPEQRLTARLREIAGSATPGLRTFAARFALDAPPDWLAIGMSATVRLVAPEQSGLAAVPLGAVGDRGDGPMVGVIDQPAGRVAARKIQVASLGKLRAVVGGLKPGELVVSLGVQKLDPAARIRVAGIEGE